MVTPAAHREAAAYLRSAHEMSGGACRVMGIDRTSVRYQATRPDDGDLRGRLRALAKSAAGSATDGCTSCCGVRAMR